MFAQQLICACIFGILAEVYGKACQEPLVYNQCGPACNKDCDEPHADFCTKQCVAGCFCPNNQLKKTNKDGSILCVDKRDNCCDGGQVYSPCGAGCQGTCENPFVICPAICVPGCVCPARKPFLYKKECVTYEFCEACSDRRCSSGSETVCHQCNKCKCEYKEDGHPWYDVKCSSRPNCPDLKKDFKTIADKGCWTQESGKKACFFSYPCIDSQKKSCSESPNGFCEKCNFCTCSKDNKPDCPVNIISCKDQLELSLGQGCWTLLGGKCTFTVPCQTGEQFCNLCNVCTCAGTQSRCTTNACQKPNTAEEGCYVTRDSGIRFIIPCPDDAIFDEKAHCEKEENAGTKFVRAKDCNTCFCPEKGEDFVIACTEKFCLPPDASLGEYVLVDGKCEFRMDIAV